MIWYDMIWYDMIWYDISIWTTSTNAVAVVSCVCFIISVKWTEWMSEIMFAFNVCLSVSVCVQSISQLDQRTTSPKQFKLWTSHLARMFSGTVPTSLKFFRKGGMARTPWKFARWRYASWRVPSSYFCVCVIIPGWLIARLLGLEQFTVGAEMHCCGLHL